MTNPELAILSLIAEKPRHGYDIEQVIEARGMREWTEIGFSSIYYLLNKLEVTWFYSIRIATTTVRDLYVSFSGSSRLQVISVSQS